MLFRSGEEAGANLVDADEFVVVDISADETKAITLGELQEAFDSDAGFVRFDSSGNLLVGTTDNTLYDNTTGGGFKAGGDDRTDMARQADIVATMNRTGNSDGTILDFRKDGTTVGSIGSVSGAVSYILLDTRSSAKGAGLLGSSIDANTGILQPVDKVGALADDAIELGTNSTRFKNLFLSGGVYLGGTGGGNHLDDFEEGLHTLTINQGAVSINNGYQDAFYTKVGRSVTIAGLILVSSAGDSNVLKVNLPFTAATRSGNQTDYFVGTVMTYNVSTGSGGIKCTVQTGTSKLSFFRTVDNGTWSSVRGNDLAAGDHLYFTITYQAT